MSLEAMDWVWVNSQSKGVARLVLLVIADKASGKEVSAYAGTALLGRRANASESAVKAAIKSLRDLGELQVISGQKGPQGETRYSLPKAVGHARVLSDKSQKDGVWGSQNPIPPGGTESDPPRQNPQPPGGTQTGSEYPPGESVSNPSGVSESDPHNAVPTTTSKQAGSERPSRDAFAAMQPLQEAMTAAGMVASWTMRAEQIGELVDTVNRVGIPAMVEHARRSWRKDNPPTYITALLRGWSGLPTRKAPTAPTQPAPEPDWCGNCAQPDYRYIDHGDDRWGPCPTCNPGAAR